MTSAARRLWDRVSEWWSSESEPLVNDFVAHGGPLIKPYGGYLRIWLSEMSLAKDRRAATDRFPALQASVRLSFGGGPDTTFSTITRPPEGHEGPSIRRDIPLTTLLPYAGGTVDIQVALLDVAGASDLQVALDILGEFSSLLTPPLSTVAGVANKVASGIGRIDDHLAANDQRPVLALQRSLSGGATGLEPGYLFGVLASPEDLPAGSVRVTEGRLSLTGNGAALTGFDYLVLRVETTADRDDWRFPEWDGLIGEAMAAQVLGQIDRFQQLRTDVLARIVTSADLTPTDRLRVASLVKNELDGFALGASGEDRHDTLVGLVKSRGLPDRLAVQHLTAADLLATAA
ncbi:MAG TPA: hypothetical protein VFR35_10835 [Actinoplanes sp.]|nr:hypothetical protein [Actinoplanes sp.]